MLVSNIILGVGNDYLINNKLYKIVTEPTEKSLSVAIIEPIIITPSLPKNVKENNLGHFEGPVQAIEDYQTLKLNNAINVGKNLDKHIKQIQKIIYLESTNNVVNYRNIKNDLLVCDKTSLSKLASSTQYDSYDFVVFKLFEGDNYVGKDVIESFPLFLLLAATYDEIVNYLKDCGMYEERWPFTHVWQNGCDFAQTIPMIKAHNFKIWSLGYFHSFNSLYVRDVMFPNLGPDDYVLMADWGAVYPASSLIISKSKYPQNIYWLTNGKYEMDSLISQGVNAKLVSHNVFINHNVFKIEPTTKKYDAIFCQSVIPFKRPLLAKHIKSIVYSTGGAPTKEYQEMIDKQRGIVVAGSSPLQVATLMNQSKCGLSLSQAEGGNYATTEYLLCGIPVITTKNIGGRDTYLDETNSICVTEDTPEAVAEAVEYIINNLEKYDPIKIREGALLKNKEMIETLKREVLEPIFIKNNINLTEIDRIVNQILNINNPNSKGRTPFQPEFSMVKF